MFLHFALYLLGFVLFCVTVLMLSYYEWRSLSFRRKCLKIPHPKMNFIFGIGLEIVKYPIDEILVYIEELWKRMGNVFHYNVMGYPNVMLINPEDIEVLFSNIKYVRKGEEYYLIRPWLGNGLLTSTGDHWHARRKQLTPSFHFKLLETYLPIFNQNANNLVEKLTKTGGQPIPISSVISACTLNIICETTMGTSLNLLTKDARDYSNAVKEVSDITVTRMLTFWWHSEWVFYLSPIGRRYRKNMRIIHSFVDRVIEERRQKTYEKVVDEEENILADNRMEFSEWQQLIHESFSRIIISDMYILNEGHENGLYKQRRSFLDHLLSIQRENPASLSDDDLRDEVNTFMFEGHDTIAAAIIWTLFMLANHRDIQDRVHDELNEVLSSEDHRSISLEDLNKLQYLEMVLKESLRLYPSVPYITRLIPYDMQIVTGGYVIPAEANVVVMPYLVHRNPKIFHDPDKFDPERFAPALAKTYHPYAYLPFSAGYRNCIGQRFAMTEGKVVLATILKKFHVSSTQKREDIKMVPSVVLRPSPDINLSFSPVAQGTAFTSV